MPRRRVAILVVTMLGLPAAPLVAGQFDLHGVTGIEELEDEHPATAAQLEKNPALIHDDEWLRKHPTLEVFLRSHPMARAELDEAPEQRPDDGEPGEDGELPKAKKPNLLESPLPARTPSLIKHPEPADE